MVKLKTDACNVAPMSYNQQIFGQVAAIVDSFVHGDEALHGGFVLDTRVVQTGVQHDDGKRQHIAGVWEINTSQPFETTAFYYPKCVY